MRTFRVTRARAFRPRAFAALVLLVMPLVVEGPLAAAEPIAIPGTTIEMLVPQGFHLASGWAGLVSEENGSSVLINELPVPAELYSGQFIAELRRHEIEPLSRETVRIDGHPGLLVSARQTARGASYGKWLLVFGDANRTHIVTATYPQDRAEALSSTLRRMLLGIRSGPTIHPARLSFTLEHSGRLKPVDGAAGMRLLMLTKNGLLPAQATGDPVFIAGRSTSQNVVIGNRRAFALQRARKVDVLQDVVIEAVEEVVVDGLPGIEIVGVGRNIALGIPVLLYQVVLFPETDYFLMQGMVADADRSEYLPMFRAIGGSFRRSRPADLVQSEDLP